MGHQDDVPAAHRPARVVRLGDSSDPLPGTEQPVTGVAESGKDVADLVQLPIERRGQDGHIGMLGREAGDPFRRGYEAEKAYARGAGALEGGDRRRRTPAGGEHRIEEEKVPLPGVTGHLEVVVDRFKRVVVAVQADMAHARGGDEAQDALHHTEPRAENRDQGELLPSNGPSGGGFEGRVDGHGLEGEIAGGLVGHEHGDFVHELLEHLGRRRAITQERELVADERVVDDGQRREGGRGAHTKQSTSGNVSVERGVVYAMSPSRQRRRIAVYCASNEGARPEYVAMAHTLGETIAARGYGLVYGGGRVGLMGAVADAALAAGGEVIGVMPHGLVAREVAHHGLTHLHVVDTMHERKAMIADLSDAFVAMPGGVGTLEEFFETWTWAQLGVHKKPVGLLDVAGFWVPLLTLLDHVEAEGFLRGTPRDWLIHHTQPAALLDALDLFEAPTVRRWLRVGET